MLAAGTALGPYRILAPLGAGGMGEVYRAHDSRLGRDVALKVLSPHLAEIPEVRARFEREARAISRLSHPHIGALYDVGHSGSLHYLVMELLDGETLARRLTRGPMPLPELLRAAIQIADALDAAHQGGLVHRDLKPGNVMLTKSGAKLLDFGLARPIGLKPSAGAETQSPTVSEPLTAEGTLVGTLQYMAPEQLEGKEADARTDVFAFGSMLYEMASGKKAFEAQSQAGVIAAIMEREPLPLSSLAPVTPPGLEHVVDRCLAKVPEQRWQTMRDVAHELEWVRDQTTSVPGRVALEPGAHPRGRPGTSRPGRRSWLLAGAVLVGVIAVAGAVAFRDTWTDLIRRDHAKPQKRQWTLVAEFDGPASDPGLASAAREMVSSVLDESSILRTVPPGQIREALRMASKPETLRVDAELARELAYRSAIRTVVSGKIDRVGAGYPITLRVHDVEGDSLLATVNGVAASEKELIPTLSRLAKQMREKLGERPEGIVATRSSTGAEAATPSFEAYRKLTRASDLALAGDETASITLCREALAIDPDFARAHELLGVNYGNLGQLDSAIAGYRRALSRPGRLTEYHRVMTEALLARQEGRQQAALAAYDRLIAEDSSRAAPWGNRAGILEEMGRFDEAVASYRQAVGRSPVAPTQISLSNLVWGCLTVGRFDEAEHLLPRLRGAYAQMNALLLERTRWNWARAESMATHMARDPTVRGDVRAYSINILNTEAIARGELQGFERRQQEAYEAWKERDPLAPDFKAWRRALNHLTLGTRPPDARTDTPEDAPAAILLTDAMVAAVHGDSLRARRLLQRALQRSAIDVQRQGASPALVRAVVATRGGRWSEVVREMDPIARQPWELGFVPYGTGQVWPRFLIAQAYEQLGRADSAAYYYEMLLPSRTPPMVYELEGQRALSSYAHYHLVLLYARLGRREEAESHWKSLSETLTRPDLSLRHWLDEARAAIAGIRSLEKGARS